MKQKLKGSNDIISINYKEINIKAQVIYRQRKNISIQIKPIDNVSIISPKNISKKILKEILEEKGDWIIEKLNEYKMKENEYKEKEYKSGEKLYYLGEEYVLKVIEDSSIKNRNTIDNIKFEDNKIIICSNNIEKEYIKKCIKEWYKKESEKIVLERIVHCRDKSNIMMRLIPSSVKVKEQKKRWGSCTSKRDIYINSKIAMARPEVIDYILVHEFSHLEHMNHSKEFYKLVESIMPSYKTHEKWLRDNSHKFKL